MAGFSHCLITACLHVHRVPGCDLDFDCCSSANDCNFSSGCRRHHLRVSVGCGCASIQDSLTVAQDYPFLVAAIGFLCSFSSYSCPSHRIDPCTRLLHLFPRIVEAGPGWVVAHLAEEDHHTSASLFQVVEVCHTSAGEAHPCLGAAHHGIDAAPQICSAAVSLAADSD